MDLYRTRQEINEHVFGTIKRTWGYTHTLLKGKRKVDGEFVLVFTAYNLHRLMSILAQEELKEALKSLKTGISGQFRPPVPHDGTFGTGFTKWGVPGQQLGFRDTGQFAFRAIGYI